MLAVRHGSFTDRSLTPGSALNVGVSGLALIVLSHHQGAPRCVLANALVGGETGCWQVLLAAGGFVWPFLGEEGVDVFVGPFAFPPS